jgi:hypothetical protein
MGKSSASSARARKARTALERQLSADDGFIGAGLSRTESGDDEIVVLVRDAESTAAANAPGEYDGVPVRTEIVGRARKF